MLLDRYFSLTAPKNTVLKNYWILNKKENKFGNAFIGPSRVLNTLDLSAFEKNSNLPPLNLGLSGAAYAEQFLILKMFIEENKNTCQNLFIEISYFNLINPDSAFSYPFHEYFYFPYMSKDFVAQTIKNNSKNKLKSLMWQYVPFIKYAEFNSNFLPLILFTSSFKEGTGDKSFDKYGSILLNEFMDKNYKIGQYSNPNTDQKNLNYLKGMIELAKKNNIKVTLFTAPSFTKSFSYSDSAYKNYQNTVYTICQQYSLPYFDFEKSEVCNDINNFSDRTHLNKTGAVKFSKIFCDTLRSLNY